MAESLFSPTWYRVAQLRPRLRTHARITRHQYRGEIWYVLQDLSSERFHRFSPSAYTVIGLMNGERTVQEIWDMALERLGDDAVSQDEVIQLLGQLHSADVLQCDVPPDTAELFRRRQNLERAKLKKQIFSIFAWQLPLFDPERLLDRLSPLVRPLYGWFGLVLWLAVVGWGLVLGWTHWPELSKNVLDRVLMPENLVVLWLLFPMIKLLHEFGHAFAVKAYGGEVHEMGVMILVLTPVPYVDASAAWSFKSKWQRVVVGGAGMGVELFLAALAMFVWVNAEPGLVRSLAYNTILIAGISTVMFNANPLLRFDGYYMLMDYVEIPNLRQRASTYLIYLSERYLFGRRDAEQPIASVGERAWFIGFSVASFVYRLLVILAILLFLGQQHLLLGLVFAGSTAFAWLVLPAIKIGKFVLSSPRIRRVRRRAVLATVGLLAGAVVILVVIPVPQRTVAEGVVWVPEEGIVRAGADGFITKVVAAPGSKVTRGDVLVECDDEDVRTELKVLEAQLRELDAKHRQVVIADRVRAEIIEEQQRYTREGLGRAQQRVADLTIRSRATGIFVLPQAVDLPGRYLKKGQMIGQVVDMQTVTVRTVVSQQDIDLVRNLLAGVDVRLAEQLRDTTSAIVRRAVPSATDRLPSQALAMEGGGTLALDPTDREGRRTVQRYFQIDVELPPQARIPNVGGRAYVRFDHGWEPLAFQWYRSLRQLFLSRLNV
jgi:putative peptide zinc metalloprotease protein